jgi:hypothetical protein
MYIYIYIYTYLNKSKEGKFLKPVVISISSALTIFRLLKPSILKLMIKYERKNTRITSAARYVKKKVEASGDPPSSEPSVPPKYLKINISMH